MKKILSLVVGFMLMVSNLQAAEKISVEKQLIGILGAISGTVKTQTRELKTENIDTRVADNKKLSKTNDLAISLKN